MTRKHLAHTTTGTRIDLAQPVIVDGIVSWTISYWDGTEIARRYYRTGEGGVGLYVAETYHGTPVAVEGMEDFNVGDCAASTRRARMVRYITQAPDPLTPAPVEDAAETTVETEDTPAAAETTVEAPAPTRAALIARRDAQADATRQDRRLRDFGKSYPALNGDPVLQGHADWCAEHGHAYHGTPETTTWCPRCGETVMLKDGALVTAPTGHMTTQADTTPNQARRWAKAGNLKPGAMVDHGGHVVTVLATTGTYQADAHSPVEVTLVLAYHTGGTLTLTVPQGWDYPLVTT